MSQRVYAPETIKIDISRGDWLLVKKHLTAGEQIDMYDRWKRDDAFGISADPAKVGIAKIAAYLLDWSFTGVDGKPLVVRDQPYDAVASLLRNIGAADFSEVFLAVNAHEQAMAQEWEARKNVPTTGTDSAPSSPSVAP